jgi:hypothetical protein
MTQELYNMGNIRELLTQGFSTRELRAICMDIPGFRPVYYDLGENPSTNEVVDKLLQHAERTLQIDTLLALARERNPNRYKKHQPYYMLDSTPAMQRQIADLARRLAVAQMDPKALRESYDVELDYRAKYYYQRRICVQDLMFDALRHLGHQEGGTCRARRYAHGTRIC